MVPLFSKDINKLEKIQKRFTTIAFNRCNIPFTSYEDRLQKIGYLSLQNRRLLLDLVYLYKIIHRLCELKFDDYFTSSRPQYNLRSHSFQIKPKLNYKSSHFHNSFFHRVPSSWNGLPSAIIESKSLSNFKHLLKCHLHNHSLTH